MAALPPGRRTWIVAGLLAIVAGIVVWAVLRPVFRPDRPTPIRGRLEKVAPVTFVNRTSEAGFTHVHHKPVLDHKLDPIMSWVASIGAAAAAGDFDRDGWMDLYVTDSDKGRPNYLYRNRGDGTFVDVAREAGVANVNDGTGVSTDAIWGDYDNDGWPDLYIVKWGRNRLYRNGRDGTFTDVTAKAFVDEKGKPGAPWANGCAAIWFDYDGDGWLDLYVGNYFAPVDLWHLANTRIMHDSFERARNAGENFFYHNNRDGTFTDLAARLGVNDTGWTLSVGHGDINNDGWPDLYSADDFGPDQLFLSGGDGTFRNITERAIGRDTKKGMNVDFGDFDNDGWLDIYVTNITTADYLKEGNMLWHNDATAEDGTPLFLDVAVDTQTYDGGWGWGAKFFDYDPDGDLDIVSVNGFITAGPDNYWYDLASWTVTGQDVTDARNWPPIGNRSFSGNEATRLWRNDGHGRFTEVAANAGLDDRRDGRGVVAFDADNDGDLDLFVANQGAAPVFYRNEAQATGRHWIGLRLLGRPEAGSNRDAIGARVTIVTAAGRQIRELDGGNSYCGQSDRRIFFGLGDERIASTLEIRWPSRRIQVLHDVPADQVLTVQEPESLPPAVSLIPRSHDAGASGRAATSGAPATPIMSTQEIQALLSGLEEQVRRAPDDLAVASRYRAQCAEHGEHDRSVAFFGGLVREHPELRGFRLQLAAAYVDEIPTCGGMAAIVCKGTLARKSLDQFNALLTADPSYWPALYGRGTNHLHWPRALGHSDDSADDFRKCIELQRREGRPDARSYYVRAHIGLGDALAKLGDYRGARRAWEEGSAIFPGNSDLGQRLALGSEEEARAYVERVRNLEQPIDTDFTFLQSP